MVKTIGSSFYTTNPQGTKLFQVAEGVPIVEALEAAFCLMDCALDGLTAIGQGVGVDSTPYLVRFAVESARAAILSVYESVDQGSLE